MDGTRRETQPFCETDRRIRNRYPTTRSSQLPMRVPGLIDRLIDEDAGLQC